MVITGEPAKRCVKIPQRRIVSQAARPIKIESQMNRIGTTLPVALVFLFNMPVGGDSRSSNAGTGGQATDVP